jgi:hypothetical protein
VDLPALTVMMIFGEMTLTIMPDKMPDLRQLAGCGSRNSLGVHH